MHSICTGGMRAGTSVQLICNSRRLQFSPPYAGSSKLGRVLDHVSLIESKPPGPETEAPSNASLKQAKFKGLLRVTKALPFVALRKLLLDNIVLIALPGAAGEAWGMPQQREVSSLLTWVASFVMCVAIVAEKHLEKVKPSCMMIREAQCHEVGELQSYVQVHSCNRCDDKLGSA